jgi:pimeloyl-ACP methyl ester carboxylesterase
VPYVDRGEARIWYTGQGTGFPVLTLAPGGMRSSVPLWEMAAINPLAAYAGQYLMIAMDQRNAGQSAGPLETGDPWGAYAADHPAVMDHLGIDRFLVFGWPARQPHTRTSADVSRINHQDQFGR